MMTRPSSILAMLLTATLFSTGGAAVKLSQLSAWQIAGGRSAIAALCLLVWLPQARRRWRKETFLVGAAYAATLVLFVHANKLTTAASTIFLQATSPLYLVVLGPLLLRESLSRSEKLLAPIIALGLSLFFVGLDPSSVTAPHPLAGNVLAALSGLTYALTILGLRSLGRRESGPGGGAGVAAAACGNALAALCCLPGALPLQEGGLGDLAVIVYLGVFQIAVAYWLMVRALEQLRALEAALLLLLEPALSPLWAMWLHGEIPSAWSWAGGAIIVAATARSAVLSARAAR